MRIEGELVYAQFVRRINRFTVAVDLYGDGRISNAFLANPGRLKELLVPGRRVLLKSAASSGTRRTLFDVIGVELEDQIVTIDSRIPNLLIREALLNGSLREFKNYQLVKSEPAFGSGRFDFLLDPKCFVEVKSCTLVKDGVALFPDAPTKRGTRHLLEMVEAEKRGYKCIVIFVVQRGDARLFIPNSDTDPEFCSALEYASSHGVEALAYKALYRNRRVQIGERIDFQI